MKKLNIGCGPDIKPKSEGWVNLDDLKLKGVDVVHSLNKFPYPFKNNEFDEVFCSHILEHVDDLIKVMRELHRITKPNGIIRIHVPHFSCGVNYRDPTHKRYFSYFTFDFFTDKCYYDTPKFLVVYSKLNFSRLSFTFLNFFMNPIINLSPAVYERFFCWILPASEVIAELKVLK
ncbi:MAG: methyltransferase domain-containing protein [Nanoarchaeota archaeon]